TPTNGDEPGDPGPTPCAASPECRQPDASRGTPSGAFEPAGGSRVIPGVRAVGRASGRAARARRRGADAAGTGAGTEEEGSGNGSLAIYGQDRKSTRLNS